MSNANQNWNDRNRQYQNNQKHSQDPKIQDGSGRKTDDKKDLSDKTYSEQRSHMMKKQQQDQDQAEKEG